MSFLKTDGEFSARITTPIGDIFNIRVEPGNDPIAEFVHPELGSVARYTTTQLLDVASRHLPICLDATPGREKWAIFPEDVWEVMLLAIRSARHSRGETEKTGFSATDDPNAFLDHGRRGMVCICVKDSDVCFISLGEMKAAIEELEGAHTVALAQPGRAKLQLKNNVRNVPGMESIHPSDRPAK